MWITYSFLLEKQVESIRSNNASGQKVESYAYG